MDHLIISGVAPYDGRYELDLGRQPFTTREWGWIKRLSGYLPVTLNEDTFTDPEFVGALAMVVLVRAGRVERPDVPAVFDRFQDVPFGTTITVEAGEEEETEADAGPPERNSNGNTPSSGESSPTSSETSPMTPPASGTPGSATSPSGPPRLAI